MRLSDNGGVLASRAEQVPRTEANGSRIVRFSRDRLILTLVLVLGLGALLYMFATTGKPYGKPHRFSNEVESISWFPTWSPGRPITDRDRMLAETAFVVLANRPAWVSRGNPQFIVMKLGNPTPYPIPAPVRVAGLRFTAGQEPEVELLQLGESSYTGWTGPDWVRRGTWSIEGETPTLPLLGDNKAISISGYEETDGDVTVIVSGESAHEKDSRHDVDWTPANRTTLRKGEFINSLIVQGELAKERSQVQPHSHLAWALAIMPNHAEFQAYVFELVRSQGSTTAVERIWLFTESGEDSFQVKQCPVTWDSRLNGVSGSVEVPDGRGIVKVSDSEILLTVTLGENAPETLRVMRTEK